MVNNYSLESNCLFSRFKKSIFHEFLNSFYMLFKKNIFCLKFTPGFYSVTSRHSNILLLCYLKTKNKLNTKHRIPLIGLKFN